MSGSGTLLHIGGGSSHDELAPPLPEQGPNGGRGAFTLLYDLFEQRVFNFCHRLLGSADDAADATQETFLAVLTGPQKRQGHDSNLRVYLFAAAHDACHDLVAGSARAQAAHQRRNGEPDEVYVDPERASLLSSLQDDVRAANRTLAETEREVLALRELEYFSYAEIAEIMRTDHESVAELLAGARLGLRDELRASALAADPAVAGPDCRRARPLIAMAQDAQPTGKEERDWLAGHLGACETCRASREAMEEAGISYRAWLRIVPPHWLREATVAQAAELADADPTQPIAGDDDDDGEQAEGGEPGAETAGVDDAAWEDPGGETDIMVAAEPARRDHDDRRRFALGAVSMLLLLLGVGAAMVIASAGKERRAATSEPAAVSDAATTGSAPAPIASATGTGQSRRRARRAVLTRSTPTTGSPGALRSHVVTSSPSRPRGSPKPVRRHPVRDEAEGGAFVPTPPRPSPPTRSTPSTPTGPLPPRPSGGVPAPSGKACGSPSDAPGAC